MIRVEDQLNRFVEIVGPAKRIVSLVPSQTELLYDLGLDDKIVGRTKFCIHPETKVKSARIVGGTKNFHVERIEALRPDLILVNKEENDADRVKDLMRDFPVWVSNVKTLPEALEMIRSVGILTGTEGRANKMVETVGNRFANLNRHDNLKTAYCIWKEPMMFAGGDTFISEMLALSGYDNVFKDELRYPAKTTEALTEIGPEIVMLSSEPFPFREKHITVFREFLPNAKIILVDGSYFSWYGSRLLNAPEYFNRLNEQVYTRSASEND